VCMYMYVPYIFFERECVALSLVVIWN